MHVPNILVPNGNRPLNYDVMGVKVSTKWRKYRKTSMFSCNLYMKAQKHACSKYFVHLVPNGDRPLNYDVMGVKVGTKWSKYRKTSPKQACSYVFVQENYIKARLLVSSPFSPHLHFYPPPPTHYIIGPLHHNGKAARAPVGMHEVHVHIDAYVSILCSSQPSTEVQTQLIIIIIV